MRGKMITMKLIKKIMTGICMAVLSVAMYYCFLNGAPRQGTERLFYMILAGIFCVSVWTAVYKMASQKENRTRKHGGDFA